MSQATLQPTSRSHSESVALSHSEKDALKKTFAEEGYFIIKNVISPEQLKALHRDITEEFDRAQKTGTLFSGGGLMSGHLNCFPGEGARFIYDTLEERGIIDLIREIAPTATRMPYIGCNFNLPGSVAQHMHTDRDFTRDFMICNVAVVDTVVENGAMELIPGSHKEYYPYWKFVTSGMMRHAIRLPMKQGDIMVRTSSTWHRGMPNKTAVPRPMIALTWEDGGSNEPDPFAIENGQIKFRPNWFKPTKLGRIREQVFVKVPISYSAYRFVSSLTGKKGY